jgi:hypothetical protein
VLKRSLGERPSLNVLSGVDYFDSFSMEELTYNLSQRTGPTPSFEASMTRKLTIAGLLIGGLVGFLLRPSVPLIGQLPFSTVITRGANLRGLDQLLLGYARTSFNYLLAGLVLGAVVGLIAAFAIQKSQATNTPTDSPPA